MNCLPKHMLHTFAYNDKKEGAEMFSLQECRSGPFGWYVICNGDSFPSVCAAHGVSYASLIAVNHLKAFPPPGTMIYLPQREKVYTVCPGDTVESICIRFNLNREEFVRRNGELLYPTQRVSICTEDVYAL